MTTRSALARRFAGVVRTFAPIQQGDGTTAEERGRPLDPRRIALQAAAMWLATRVALLALTFLAAAYGLTPDHIDLPQIFPFGGDTWRYLIPPLGGQGALTNWANYDGAWYLLIGTHGYDVFTASSTNWFPLYGLAINLLVHVFGPGSALFVALALSNLGTLAGFVGLGLLAAHEERSEGAAWRLIAIIAAYPFAFFLFAPYSEGFFLAFVVFALYFARRGRWWPAALCAFLAGLTRSTGIALVLPLAWEYGRQHDYWRLGRWRDGGWRTLLRPRALALGATVVAAVPLAVGSYMLFLKLRYGDPFLYLESQATMHFRVNWPVWKTAGVLLKRFVQPPADPSAALRLYLDGGVLVVFAAITIAGLRRLPFIYSLYMLATLYLLLSVPAPRYPELVVSPGRYLIMAVPVFLLLARWAERRPWLGLLLVGGGFMVQALFAMVFLRGGFIE